ncbi:universal stress protein [Yeosuana marina]|uniref:universal stress protein n=1 Tax=Yeosuana marina TaxID=1565536 RepID=UPI001421A153|nr:universal stress protein [Yeosuana marina]
MKSILLPTDFSKNSENAIKYAMELFKDVPCTFYVLNVQKASSFISDDMMAMASSATIYQTIVEVSKKSLTNLIAKIEKKYKNEKHSFQSVVDYDNFIDSINQISINKQIDLIVMGTKGASGLERVVFGSNTVHVMQRCIAPVLAIPDGCLFTNLDRIVFSTNNLTLHNVEELKPLKDLLVLHKSKLNVLHFDDFEGATNQKKENKLFLKKHFSNVITYENIDSYSKDFYKTVSGYIHANDIKLIALMRKKHSFLERLFNQHPEETLAFNIDIPFLVMENT